MLDRRADRASGASFRRGRSIPRCTVGRAATCRTAQPHQPRSGRAHDGLARRARAGPRPRRAAPPSSTPILMSNTCSHSNARCSTTTPQGAARRNMRWSSGCSSISSQTCRIFFYVRARRRAHRHHAVCRRRQRRARLRLLVNHRPARAAFPDQPRAESGARADRGGAERVRAVREPRRARQIWRRVLPIVIGLLPGVIARHD